ncbi:hypothetical protein RHSIM_Rhsim06G0209300 [Rhododendron simsii]|uniref:Uncharacterized protein n=1 Tax=Rhododendron simsii TaxID=118357 RepID=A0A834GXK5_RHOSS|nr:hypothetical protein RHSIM_Rhsim06G0209300 [Rhododendron simsii]
MEKKGSSSLNIALIHPDLGIVGLFDQMLCGGPLVTQSNSDLVEAMVIILWFSGK